MTGRDSYIDPNQRQRYNYRTIIEPDEKKRFSFKQISVAQLYNMTVSEAIEKMIETSDALSFAIDLYISHTVRGYSLEGKSDKSKRIIEEMIAENKVSGDDFLTTLKRMAYGIYVEGASCSELVFDETGTMAKKIVYVSPFSLSFQLVEDEELKQYYLIGQRDRMGKLDPILQDEKNPNELFIYTPVNVRAQNVYGSSQITPALFSTTSIQDIVRMMIDFLQGQVFPKGVYTIDTNAMAAAGFTAKQITDEAKRASQILEGTLNSAEITQDIVLSTPILMTVVGMLEKAGLDGIEMIIDVLESIERRGLKVPEVFFGNRRSGTTALNDTSAQYELLEFFLRIISIRDIIEDDINRHFETITRHAGEMVPTTLKLDDNDELLSLIFAEILDKQMDSMIKLNQLNVTTQQELREILIRMNKAFAHLPAKLPPELQNTLEEMIEPPANNGEKETPDDV